MPEALGKDMAMSTSCIAGASSLPDLESMLRQAGFKNIRIRPKDQSRTFIRDWLPGSRVEDSVVSASIEAVRPQG